VRKGNEETRVVYTRDLPFWSVPMNNENIIAWNVANWITVILMAAIGFFAIGAFQKWYASKSAQPQPQTSNG
jgi:hypothetical protein